MVKLSSHISSNNWYTALSFNKLSVYSNYAPVYDNDYSYNHKPLKQRKKYQDDVMV